MRTTVSIEDHLLALAKERAQQRALTLGQLVERALRRELARDSTAGDRSAIPVFEGGSGPRPGIELTSNRSLLEALDEDTPLDQMK
ncbi:MAG TPA: hypothetical protein VG184_07450 [Acidimicrobiales bacterium]|nr:hypothetical protein [Acidimicrobiales bacterium]